MSEVEKLKAALGELIKAVDMKASGLADPKKFYSPRMEDAIEAARKLLGN